LLLAASSPHHIPNPPSTPSTAPVTNDDASEARKRTTEAIQMWKRAVELDPTQANSLEALGQAYLDRGEFDRAIASCREALGEDAFATLREEGRLASLDRLHG